MRRSRRVDGGEHARRVAAVALTRKPSLVADEEIVDRRVAAIPALTPAAARGMLRSGRRRRRRAGTREPMVQLIRPSTTQGTLALWLKSLLNAALFFAVFMVVLPWGAARLVPQLVPVPAWLGLIGGGALCVAGAGLWVWSLDLFSRVGRGTPFPLDAPSHLVAGGPFAIVRNPIMAGELAIIWGEALACAALGVFVYAAIVTLAAHVLVVRVEEPELRQRFGAPYEAYCQRMPRWLPRLGRAAPPADRR